MTHCYFAYGSNLDPHQMARRCPGSCPVGPAVLADHRLVFPVKSEGDWGGGVAGIAPTPGEQVHGVVYTVTDNDLAKLDVYEAVAEGMYRREAVSVTLITVDADQPAPTTAWTYFAQPRPGQRDAHIPPSRRYLDALLRGAEHHGLPAAYRQQLADIPTHA